MRRQFLNCTLLFLAMLFLFCQPANAQYDGSFDNLYFDRTIDATSASLGSISKSIFNNAFSVHQNAALLSFQDGYSAAYSHSSPFYNFGSFDRRFNYFGISAKPFSRIAVGISSFALRDRDIPELRLSTIAGAYNINEHLSVGTNLRLFAWDLSAVTNNTIEEIFTQWYVDVSSAARFPYQLKGADARITAGLTFENIFRQALDVSTGFGGQGAQIELPSIVTVSANHKLRWETGSNFLLTEQLSWKLLGEYQNVVNHDFRTRYSLGTQLGFGDILFLRGGYYYETLNDFGISSNKSSLSEFTYGIGAHIPVSRITGTGQEIMLSVDFVRMPQPLFATNNLFNFGHFSTISVALQVVLF